MKKSIIAFLTIFIVSTIYAVSTSFYLDDTIKDFERGQIKNLSINEKGELYLAPATKSLLSQRNNFIWDITSNKKGDIYAAAGLQSKIYHIQKSGKVKVIATFKSSTKTIRKLLFAPDGRLLAAVSPKGAIIAIDKNGKKETIANFTETYIWDMTLAPDGTLYVATGNAARIYAVSLKNKSKKMLYESKKESHFLCCAINKAGHLFFGSEGEGRLYKLDTRTKKTKLLYDSYEDDISCIHINKNGVLYFGTASQSRKRLSRNFNYKNSFDFREKEMRVKKVVRIRGKIKKRKPLINSIYKLDTHDKITKVFTMRSTSFFSLLTDQNGNLLAGTGNYGVIYKISPKGVASRLLRLKSNLVIKMAILNGTLYAATGNEGNIYTLKFAQKTRGTYTSIPYDCYTPVTWGSIAWIGENPTGTSIRFYTRTGNSDTPDETWSKWAATDPQVGVERITSPSARYIQYRIVMQSSRLGLTPRIQSVKIPFLRRNRAPRVKKVFVRNFKRYKKKKKVSFTGNRCLIAWFATDDDRDRLSYAIYFRFAQGPHWRLFRSRLYRNKFSFSTKILPDGYYYFRVVASDKRSNTDETYKTGWKDSKKILIDNTAPLFSDLKTRISGKKIIITGKLADNFSSIAQIRYSINALSWHNSHPEDLVFDSKNERFKIVIDKEKSTELLSGKNLIILRAADAQKNWITHKFFFTVLLKKGDFSFYNNKVLFFMQNKMKFK